MFRLFASLVNALNRCPEILNFLSGDICFAVFMSFASLVNALNLRPDPDLFGFFRVCETRCAQTVADFILKNAA